VRKAFTQPRGDTTRQPLFARFAALRGTQSSGSQHFINHARMCAMNGVKKMKEPGPDHPIAIAPHAGRVRVTFGGATIADTRRALALSEAGYRVVLYIPRDDADMSLFKPSAHKTYCPYKGDASYFSIQTGGRSAENAVWSYEQPYPAVKAIKDHLAFYPDRVDAIVDGA
jgi:uncharacterized protein (DUF427 family)